MLPRRALDDRPTGLELAVAHRGVDHREPDAILHAAAGIEVLDLREHRARAIARHLAQPDERRVADRLKDVVVEADTLEHVGHERYS